MEAVFDPVSAAENPQLISRDLYQGPASAGPKKDPFKWASAPVLSGQKPFYWKRLMARLEVVP